MWIFVKNNKMISPLSSDQEKNEREHKFTKKNFKE